ncbi:Piso0_000678 [Millerozyma farinosa CBS 7064]|uniref:RING-type E3 ubiquitin transferase n=1 Tax=Pichia sorbitophila (strain ATCC MYA-4447 / BCRC 22081 / CBS 7064 / NBRC 10061 / NRRL Y-12695) TaxID=559304 RepID=G8YPR7_PICSO|nr:Piso0_000678 [Millerozyma farinosa CBS 7064]
MSNPNDIRAKRLARLAALSASNSNDSEKPENRERQSRASEEPEQTVPHPKKEKKDVQETPYNMDTDVKTPNKTINAQKESQAATPEPEISLSEEEQIARWFTREIEHLFVAGVDKEYCEKRRLIYLADSYSEVLALSHQKFDKEILESIFMEILTERGAPNGNSPVEYLFSIYKKAFQLRRILSKKDNLYDVKADIINSIISFSCSYSFICFQEPDMFLQNDVRSAVSFFIFNSDSHAFLIDIINTIGDQESLLELLNIFLPVMSADSLSINLSNSNYTKYLSLYETFVSIKSVAAIFTQVNGFNPPNEKEPLDYELKTLLGPLLRFSPLVDTVSVYYFTESVDTINKVQLNSMYESLQNEYKVVSDRLFYIVDKIIRGSPKSRSDLMNWFGRLINLSHLRRGTHADFSKLPSDGISFNISYILIRLSLPFLDYPTFSKIDKIDPMYFGKSNLIDISEETRVNSSIQASNEYFSQQELSSDVNFISDCFYLTLTYFHYGIGGIYIHFDRLKSQIKQLSSRVEMMNNNQVPPGTNPMMAHLFRAQLPTLTKTLNKMKAMKHAIQAVFSFRSQQLNIFDFLVGSTVFLTRVIDPQKQHPNVKLSIPLYKVSAVSELDDQEFLRTKTPEPWKYFPEYIIEGLINYCKFITNFRGCPLVSNEDKLQLFVEFAIIILRCPELVSNPHMKAHLIEVLFIGSLPSMDGGPGFMTPIFNTNKLVVDNILYSLLDFYVMVEKTGASSQFYDKFNTRYYISVILEELWKNETYRLQLHEYTKSNADFFIRFIARMLNDITYLLDEAFNELNQIHNYQQETKSRARGMPPNSEYGTDQELADNLSSSERKARSYVDLSNKSMELFKLFTKQTPEGFELTEIVDRLASMLDYNLSVMVGPKCSNLKVEDPKKYNFDPKRTLSDLCEVYNNLSKQDRFLVAVARDGRSFDLKYFQKAVRILSSKTFTDPQIVKNFLDFGERAEKQRQEDDDEEMELGDIPDEFLDPLMFILMEDPVILPGSKVSIDRSTIKTHLLSDPTDPFNRMPLKLEDVTDDVELKTKIEEFKRQKKLEKQQNDVEMKDA